MSCALAYQNVVRTSNWSLKSPPHAPRADLVQLISAEYVGAWELPQSACLLLPAAVLIRPDIISVGRTPNPAGLADAVTAWFGPPSTA